MMNILIVDDVSGWRDFNENAVREILGDSVQIEKADSAMKAYDLLLQENSYDLIITDLQMEDSFMPKYAGEWLIEQIKSFSRYRSTKIVLISASYNIRNIAETLGVECIPKSTAIKCLSAYEEVLK